MLKYITGGKKLNEFLFESIRGNKIRTIAVNQIIHEDARQGLGNYASLHLNKQGGFFIHLIIESLKEAHIKEFRINTPEFRIHTKDDKSYMLVRVASNLPIFEFLFDISIYKNHIKKEELELIIKNSFQIALIDSDDIVRAIKIVELNNVTYENFQATLFKAFENPNFSREYRVFLLPFYDKSTDRWWNIIKE